MTNASSVVDKLHKYTRSSLVVTSVYVVCLCALAFVIGYVSAHPVTPRRIRAKLASGYLNYYVTPTDIYTPTYHFPAMWGRLMGASEWKRTGHE